MHPHITEVNSVGIYHMDQLFFVLIFGYETAPLMMLVLFEMSSMSQQQR